MKKMNFDEKLDLILQEISNLKNKLEELNNRLTALDLKNEDSHKKIFENLEQLDNRLTAFDLKNEDSHKKFFENINRLDRRITILKSDNIEAHTKIIKYLDSINSAFIRYETVGTDKIRILFDSDVDRKNHQDIYGHEFKRLNDLVAKNSFRISNLEQHLQQN